MRRLLEVKLDPNDFPFYTYEHTPSTYTDILHMHDYFQIGLCLKGKGKFIFSDKKYDVTPGDIFIVNNFEHHIAESESEDPAKFLFIFFLPQLIANPGSSTFDFEYLSPFWYNPKFFCNKISGKEEPAKLISVAIKEIYNDWQNKETGYKHLIIANIRKVLGFLIRHYKTTEKDLFTTHTINQKRLQPVLDHVRSNYRSNLSLKEVSQILHMSTSRFRHYFKEITNYNFKEYIFYLRVAEAERMLLETEASISDIACNVGFSNLNQFYTVFFKYVSISPAKYRKSSTIIDGAAG
jgi:AraC-like DNA-binding protein